MKIKHMNYNVTIVHALNILDVREKKKKKKKKKKEKRKTDCETHESAFTCRNETIYSLNPFKPSVQ